MTTTINADTVVGGAVVTADASGELALQAAGVTKLTVASGGVTLASALPIASGGTNSTATATAGGAVYGTGTAYAITSAGTSGQVLQSNGASAPSWITPSSSALIFISSATASSSASLTFTSGISSTYACYLFEFVQVRPASDGPYFNMRTSSNGGSSYDSTSGNYVWASLALSSDSASANVQNGSTTATLMALATTGVGNSTNENGVSGFLRLWAPSASAYTVQDSDLVWTGQSTNNCCGRASGMRSSTSPVNAVQFLFDSGNIASGTIRMYGVANS